MPAAVIEILVIAAELAAKYGPGLVEVGANLIDAIESHGDLSDEEKGRLIARVKATRAAVAAYRARPTPPDPKPTAR